MVEDHHDSEIATERLFLKQFRKEDLECELKTSSD